MCRAQRTRSPRSDRRNPPCMFCTGIHHAQGKARQIIELHHGGICDQPDIARCKVGLNRAQDNYAVHFHRGHTVAALDAHVRPRVDAWRPEGARCDRRGHAVHPCSELHGTVRQEQRLVVVAGIGKIEHHARTRDGARGPTIGATRKQLCPMSGNWPKL